MDDRVINVACAECETAEGKALTAEAAVRRGWAELCRLRHPQDLIDWYDHIGLCPRCAAELRAEGLVD